MGCLTFVVVIITSICRCACSSCSSESKHVKDSLAEVSHRVHLNDTLTNAMSE